MRPPDTTSAHDNASWLRARFVELVCALRPSSALDVGCGSGAVLEALAAAEIQASGVERGEAALDAARARGLDVRQADADALPFADQSFDWVVMRHVVHHVADERPVLAEAWRVARAGIVVAEPCYDASIASQRVAQEIDEWLKELDRRGGEVHRSNLTPEELLAALPAPAEASVYRWLRLRTHDRDELRREVDRRLATVRGPGDAATWARLEAKIEASGVTLNGSVAVVARC